ncbi:DegV family protein, partial [Sharpea azabuensis]
MKIAITTDSGSGISQQEAKRLGITVIPMPFMIDNETYFEGINITESEFYQALNAHLPIHTS